MKFKHVWIVFRKEVKDIIRDRKTVITSLLVPMILIPLLNILVGGSVEKLQKDINENVTIALSQNSNTAEVRDIVENRIIKDYPHIRLIDASDPIEAINNSEVRVVLDYEKDYAEKMKKGTTFTIELFYDKSQTKSEGSLWIITDAIQNFNRKIVEERLASIGISSEILEPAIVKENSIASEERTSGSMLSMFLPLLIVILMSSGGIAPATDLVAGEKERNTFEPLLTTKPGRSSLLFGKYLAVTLFSFITVIATMFGVFIGYFINPSSMTMGTGEPISAFSIPPVALLLVIVTSITLGMTFSGIQIALSTYAKSFKEAQTYLSFLMIAVMIPGYATMFMQSNEISPYMFLVPVLNTISAFKIVLGFNINYTYLLMALGSSLIYVVLALSIAATLFKKEKMLFRT